MGFFADVGPLQVFVSQQVRLDIRLTALALTGLTAHPSRHEI